MKNKIKIPFDFYASLKIEGWRENYQPLVCERKIDEFFNQNLNSYMVPEKRSISYIVIDPNNFKDQFTPSNTQIENPRRTAGIRRRAQGGKRIVHAHPGHDVRHSEAIGR